MSKKSENPLLTQFEAEIMTILWKLGEASVRDILNSLPAERKVAYTSVATIVKILEEKNFVSSVKAGKTHTFVPRLQKDTYQKKTLRHIVEQLFEGTTSSLVKNLISDESISEEEKQAIKKLIEEKL
jgi:predicted transcriptional regulator